MHVLSKYASKYYKKYIYIENNRKLGSATFYKWGGGGTLQLWVADPWLLPQLCLLYAEGCSQSMPMQPETSHQQP